MHDRRTRNIARLVVIGLVSSLVGLGGWVLAPTPAGAAANPPRFVTKWGTPGSGNGQFDNPQAAAVDGDGNVYVLDTGNNRVQKFTSTGTFVTTWGTTGNQPGQFDEPTGVAVDGDGNVYVADAGNHRIQKFTSTGSFLLAWGSVQSFSDLRGVAVDGDGNVYATDHCLCRNGPRVAKFTSTGTLLLEWGSHGSGNGQFGTLGGIAADRNGRVYVNDIIQVGGVNVNRIQKFTSTGTFITKWGSRGSGDGQFGDFLYLGLAADGDGHVYASDPNLRRVQMFSSTGAFITKWGSSGTGNGQFNGPVVAAGPQGDVYVLDAGNSRVQRFRHAPRPDGRIQRGSAALVGNNVYNATGTNQSVSGSAARGSTVTYRVVAQNDALFTEPLTIRGGASTASFTVEYLVAGVEVTDQITAGTYTTPSLAPGATASVKIVVTVESAAAAGASLSRAVTVTSTTDDTKVDRVKFVTSRA